MVDRTLATRNDLEVGAATAVERARTLRALRDLDEDLREPVGQRHVRAMPGRNLDRFHSKALARHVSLPLRPDRAVVAGDDVRRRDLRRERDPFVKDGAWQEEAACRQGPLERRIVAVVVKERRCDGVILDRSFPIQSGLKAACASASTSSAKLASGSGTHAASQTWCRAWRARAAAGSSGPDPEWARTIGAAIAPTWRRMSSA